MWFLSVTLFEIQDVLFFTITSDTTVVSLYWIAKSSWFVLKYIWLTMETIARRDFSLLGIEMMIKYFEITYSLTYWEKLHIQVILKNGKLLLRESTHNMYFPTFIEQTVVPIGIGIIATQETLLASEICEELWTANSPHIQMYLSGTSFDILYS